MRRIILPILILFAFCSSALAVDQGFLRMLKKSASCNDTTGTLIAQDFESCTDGTGDCDALASSKNVTLDNSELWSTSIGTAAAITTLDTTATVLRGAQQLKITGGTTTAKGQLFSPAFAGTSPLYFHFKFKTTVGTTHGLAEVYHTGGGLLCVYKVGSDGKLQVQSVGGTNQSTTSTISSDTAYHLWGSYTAATGTGTNDAICTVNFGTTTTKPANSGNQYQVSNNGTHNSTDTAVQVAAYSDQAIVNFFDQIRVKASEMTSVCD